MSRELSFTLASQYIRLLHCMCGFPPLLPRRQCIGFLCVCFSLLSSTKKAGKTLQTAIFIISNKCATNNGLSQSYPITIISPDDNLKDDIVMVGRG